MENRIIPEMMKVLSSHSLHLVLSLFFLPMIMVYAMTGLLYLGGVDQHFTSRVVVYELDASDQPPYADSCRELERRGVVLPEGKVKPFKGNHILGPMTNTHVMFLRKGSSLRAEVVDPGVYPNLMLVHKGKAGWWFTVLGYGGALSLAALYVTGILLVWRNRRKRKLMLVSVALGAAAVVAGYLML